MEQLPTQLQNIDNPDTFYNLFDEQDTATKVIMKCVYQKKIEGIKIKSPIIKDEQDHFYTIYTIYQNTSGDIKAICYCKSYKLGCKASYVYNATKKNGTCENKHIDEVPHKHRSKLLVKARKSNDDVQDEFNGFEKAQQLAEENPNMTVKEIEQELIKLNQGKFSQLPTAGQIRGYITARNNKNNTLPKDELQIYIQAKFDNKEKMLKGVSVHKGKQSITFAMQFFIELATDKDNPVTQFFNDSSFRTPDVDHNKKRDRRIKMQGKWYQYDVLSGKCPKTNMILPLFFSLMGGKEKDDYTHQFNQYQRITQDYTGRQLQIYNVKQDYELSRKNAWDDLEILIKEGEVYKIVKPKTEACSLHFMINSKKKIHSVVKGAFKKENRRLTWKILFLISCLQYINPLKIEATFRKIQQYIQLETNDYNEYFEYIYDIYVNPSKAIYQYSFWNYYEQLKDKDFRKKAKFSNIDIENFFLQMARIMEFVKTPSPQKWINVVKNICQLKLKHWMDYLTNPNERKYANNKYRGDMYLKAESPFSRKFINKMMKYKSIFFGKDSDDVDIPEVEQLLDTFNEDMYDNINNLPYFDGDLQQEDQTDQQSKNQNKMEEESQNIDEEEERDVVTPIIKSKKKKRKTKKMKNPYDITDDELLSGFSSLDSSEKESEPEKEDVFKRQFEWQIIKPDGSQLVCNLPMKPSKCVCLSTEIIRKSYNYQKPYRACQNQKCKYFKWLPVICVQPLKKQHPWLYNNELAKNFNGQRTFQEMLSDSEMELEEEQINKKIFKTPYNQQKKKQQVKKLKQQYIEDDYQ